MGGGAGDESGGWPDHGDGDGDGDGRRGASHGMVGCSKVLGRAWLVAVTVAVAVFGVLTSFCCPFW